VQAQPGCDNDSPRGGGGETLSLEAVEEMTAAFQALLPASMHVSQEGEAGTGPRPPPLLTALVEGEGGGLLETVTRVWALLQGRCLALSVPTGPGGSRRTRPASAVVVMLTASFTAVVPLFFEITQVRT
jgi:hypothetical protein